MLLDELEKDKNGIKELVNCYSKDEQIHDNVIGMYIERFYFKTGKCSHNVV
jgi:hypothetical protein